MHNRDGQIEVRITLEALCELIRTHPSMANEHRLIDLLPSHVYIDNNRGIVHIIGSQSGLQSLNKATVCEGGERQSIGLITTDRLKKVIK